VGDPAAHGALRDAAIHTIVDDERDAHYIAEVDAPLRVPLGWDESLINALESGTAAISRALRYEELVTAPDRAIPPYATLARLGFPSFSEIGRAEATAGAGIRLRRVGERASQGAWVDYGCLVDTMVPSLAIG
jgi:hypothetical protein